MATRATLRAAAFAAMLATVAAAEPYDGVADCQRHATNFYKSRDADFRSFVIERGTVEESAYDASVGSQHVTAIFRGRASYADLRGKHTGTFICLHAGAGKGAVFVYLLPK